VSGSALKLVVQRFLLFLDKQAKKKGVLITVPPRPSLDRAFHAKSQSPAKDPSPVDKQQHNSKILAKSKTSPAEE